MNYAEYGYDMYFNRFNPPTAQSPHALVGSLSGVVGLGAEQINIGSNMTLADIFQVKGGKLIRLTFGENLYIDLEKDRPRFIMRDGSDDRFLAGWDKP